MARFSNLGVDTDAEDIYGDRGKSKGGRGSKLFVVFGRRQKIGIYEIILPGVLYVCEV